MRILVAGLVGGIVMFMWGALAHLALGLGNVGIKTPVNENIVLTSLQQGLGTKPGVYIVPWIDPGRMGDASAIQAYAAKSRNSPYAWIVYMPQGEDLTQMGRQLPRQWASDTLAALALAFVLAFAGLGFGRRIAIAGAVAIYAWLNTMVPYWNWYRFPADFVHAALIEQLIGWLLAGAAMAWWLGRSERKRAL
jgi:hypothetical protein